MEFGLMVDVQEVLTGTSHERSVEEINQKVYRYIWEAIFCCY